MGANDDLILDMLIAADNVTFEQAEKVRTYAEENKVDILEALVKMDVASEDEILMFLSAEFGMDTFDLSNYKIPSDIIEQVPRELARRYKVLPVMLDDGTLIVAMSDPTDLDSLDSLRYILKRDIEGVVAPRKQVVSALDYYYGDQENVDSFLQDMTETDIDVTTNGLENADGESNEEDAESEPIIRLVSLVIIEAIKNRASDIHLEPMEKRFRVRYRIDGVLKEFEGPPLYLKNNVISRIKIMSRLDISEHRIPLDGRIQLKQLGKQLDLRVSTVPTSHGESIVMRILDKSNITIGIPELGFLGDDQKTIQHIINLPNGLFLVTGPTGSGKSTSLYAFLNSLNEPSTKIITVEDPVEYELNGINQVNVRAETGFTFGSALRAILRQSPNIIMVGEIRDLETGEIAINAALTGHLVFSTLHTNDAPTAVTRLMDMGVKPFLVVSALKAAMAQRLVRKICDHCAQPHPPEPEEMIALRLPEDYFEGSEVKKGVGCQECANGYKGRRGIFEIFTLDDEIQDMIYKGATSGELAQRAHENGMRTLRQDGLRKVTLGITTVEELLRVTAADEATE